MAEHVLGTRRDGLLRAFHTCYKEVLYLAPGYTPLRAASRGFEEAVSPAPRTADECGDGDDEVPLERKARDGDGAAEMGPRDARRSSLGSRRAAKRARASWTMAAGLLILGGMLDRRVRRHVTSPRVDRPKGLGGRPAGRVEEEEFRWRSQRARASGAWQARTARQVQGLRGTVAVARVTGGGFGLGATVDLGSALHEATRAPCDSSARAYCRRPHRRHSSRHGRAP